MNKKVKNAKILKYAKKIKCVKLLGSKCIKCGDENMTHLVFHHIYDKQFNICDIIEGRWTNTEKELEKCQLLCGNCHAEIHFVEKIKHDSVRKSKSAYLQYRGDKCESCGYNKCEAALTFHHREPKNKIFTIGQLGIRITNISELDSDILKELDKCDVLCRNCHSEIHFDTIFYEKNENEIYEKVKNYKEIQSKISRTEVIYMYNNGMKQIDIAKHFNASKGTISDILKEWKL